VPFPQVHLHRGDDAFRFLTQTRSLEKRVEKLDYMHMNPLERKLADHPMDWTWSSFSFYAKLKGGLIRVDPVK